jgi:signal transduction histidine kinase
MRRAPRGAMFAIVGIERRPARAGRKRADWLVASGRQAHWIAADCVAAVVLLVVLTSHAAGQRPQFGLPGWLAVMACVFAAVPIAVRRLWPREVFAVVLTANTLSIACGVSGNPAVPVAIAAYTIAATCPARRSAASLAAALALTLFAQAWWGLAGRPAPPGQVLEYLLTATAALLGAAWAVGAMQRRNAARTGAELARRAAIDERLRIARELHDVISHGLTLITAKAGVTNYLTRSGEGEVQAALEIIEQTGRETLAELRRMLAVLRADDGASPLTPTARGPAVGETGTVRVPAAGLTGLASLTAQATAAGVPTSLDIQGEGGISETMGLTVYRIVQEALTNVIKHAGPARCAVRVDLAIDYVSVQITDDGRQVPAAALRTGGYGIIGMRERAELYGGDLSAGPRPDGGFRVAATLPVGSPGSGASVRGQALDG